MSNRTIGRVLHGAALALALGASVPAGAGPAAAQGTMEAPAAGAIDLNTATADELTQLPGIGPAKAAAIVAYRERRPFRRIEELMRVRGIGRATFRNVRALITVSGPGG